MRRRLHFVTFASTGFEDCRDRIVASATRSRQFAEVVAWDESRLRSDPTFAGKHLLEHKRGFGYWSWKPHIIHAELERVSDGDVVVYSDPGRYGGGYTVARNLERLVAFAETNGGMLPGVSIPHVGPNLRWTHRDCFVLMGCDSSEYWQVPQVQAAFSVWIRNPRALAFVTEWRRYCADYRVVGDGPSTCGLPELPGFQEHRSDQSVLTNLALKHGVSPFRLDARTFRLLAAIRPFSLSVGLLSKDIDNVSALSAGWPTPVVFPSSLLRAKRSATG